jgi:hypothetical protein
MRKAVIGIVGAIALMLAGVLAWNAEATPLTGVTSTSPAMSHSLVERVACGVWGPVCGGGRTLVCRPLRGCWCAPCWRRWRY